jgi:hypothetical protein
MIKRRQFLRNIQVLDLIISTGICIYDTLEGFQRRGTQKKYNIIIFDQLILIYRAIIGKRDIPCTQQ